MNNSYLPVGSVVLLKDATVKIVINGYLVKEESNDKIWDYIGSPYPIGVVNPNKNLLFDKDQIEKVVFKGYTDEEGQEFINFLNSEDIKKNG